MSAAIRTTIVNALTEKLNVSEDYINEQYASTLQVAVDALQEREYDLVDTLIEKADGYGYATTAREILESVGLTERPAPEPEPEVVAPAEEQDPEAPVTRAEFNTLAGNVSKLVDAVSGLTRYIKGDSVNN